MVHFDSSSAQGNSLFPVSPFKLLLYWCSFQAGGGEWEPGSGNEEILQIASFESLNASERKTFSDAGERWNNGGGRHQTISDVNGKLGLVSVPTKCILITSIITW